ncbi:MAG: DUF1153 domain-containing protein [Alphaproteobacteria bacterium HGW-Alphaproteobacteria-2]|nr:MAG: DUF1153 domain-containing protein [Alphaproteobacteria bacterium HGW-Alphaproteobacteria-2]
MYLRRMQGPASVLLPDGCRMTRADLPAPDTRRWVASRKAAVARAVTHGLITEDEACARYRLSTEELAAWCTAFARDGEAGLRVTRRSRIQP